MADRVFAGIVLIVAIAYTAVAFAVIRAPFQYDPLGPETWPRLLGVAAILCAAWILVRPDVLRFDIDAPASGRLGLLIVMLGAYAWTFRPVGFVISTFAFCVALSLMLGARPMSALVFGAVTGVAGYVVGVHLLDLNLPEGIVEFLG